MKKKFAITFCGGAGRVTGSSFLLEAGEKKMLVDCGLIQGGEDVEKQNEAPFLFNPEEIGVLLVTHAHIDHIGRIPLLFKRGFRGEIYSTPETLELAPLMLEDALKVLSARAQQSARAVFFSEEDIKGALSLWKPLSPQEEKEFWGARVRFLSSGHILGAAMAEIAYDGRTALITGDLGADKSVLLDGPDQSARPDYLIMESVYGDRLREPADESRRDLIRIITAVYERGGTVLIPSFALERTQILLYELNALIESGAIPSMPVFVDSPLAVDITRIYRESIASMGEKVVRESAGDAVFDFPRLTLSRSSEESRGIEKISGPKIIIAGSGMSSGGRVRSHEKEYLGDARNAIVFVGYQVPGSTGRQIAEGGKRIRIDGAEVDVRAQVVMLRGYSGHRDHEGLMEFAQTVGADAKQIFVVMGEPKSALFLCQRIRDFLGKTAIAPHEGERYELL